MKFRTKLEQAPGMKATGITVPPEIVERLGAGKRPKVVVGIKKHSYRSTIAVMNGRLMLPVAAEHRDAAGVKANDMIEVTLTLDEAPRTVDVPEDLARALAKKKGARAAFDALSYTARKEAVRSVEGAKTEETRARRVAKVVEGVG